MGGGAAVDRGRGEMIYGERIRLRSLEKSDLPKSHEWINDPQVNDGLAIFLPMSMQDEEQWLENAGKREQAERPLAIEIKEGPGWHMIGNCGVFNIEWMNRAAELGILIGDKTVWNQGYGTETMK